MLVVDDDATVRGIIAEILSERGRVVLTAASGYEALGILADRHIDLLITDIRMPGLDGFDLARQAKLMRPGLHVIFLSGSVTQDDQVAGGLIGPMVDKPVNGEDLRKLIARVFGVPKTDVTC